MADKFYGDDLRWFVGIVVNHTPPPGHEGYVKVRIRGVHSSHTVDIPEADLPWAQVMVPTTEQGVSGLGSSPTITTGSNVFGMFIDGKDSQVPLILGSLPKTESVTPLQLKTLESTKFPFIHSWESVIAELNNSSNDLSEMVVHWTETPSNKNIGAVEIDAMHKDVGYDGIQYHYVILRDGTLQRGINIDTSGLDGNKLSVAFVGGLNCPTETKQQDRFLSVTSLTRSQFNSFEKICDAYLTSKENGTITAHSSSDPSIDLDEYVQSIFRR